MPLGGSSSTGATHRSSDGDGSEAASSNGHRTGTAPTSTAKKKQRGKKTPTATASSASHSGPSAARAAFCRTRTRDAADNASHQLRSISGNPRSVPESRSRSNGKKSAIMEAVDEIERLEAKANEEYQEWKKEQHQANKKLVDNNKRWAKKIAEDLKVGVKQRQENFDDAKDDPYADLGDHFEADMDQLEQEAKAQEEKHARDETEQEKTNKKLELRLKEKDNNFERERKEMKQFSQEPPPDRSASTGASTVGGNGGDSALEVQRHKLRRIKSLVVGILFGDDTDAVKILQLSEKSMEMAVLAIQSKLVTKVDEDVLYSDRMTSAIQDVVRDYKRAASTTTSEGD